MQYCDGQEGPGRTETAHASFARASQTPISVRAIGPRTFIFRARVIRLVIPLRFLRSALRPLAGRERTVWRLLRAPRLRYWFFRDPLDVLIYSVLMSEPDVHVISVGSNDGRQNDPIWTFRFYRSLRGLLVEPFGPAFRRLESNYAPWGERFTLGKL